MQRNLENHSFCRSKDIGIYGTSLKTNKAANLSKEAINKVISLLFVSLNDSQKKSISIIMKNQFNINRCVVLRANNGDAEFENFLFDNGLDIGRMEAIVMSDGKTVQFTHDFRYYPEVV